MDEFARATNKTDQGDAVTSTETPAPPAKKQAGTEYVVLLHNSDEGTKGRWDQVGADRVRANSAEEAIRDVVAKFKIEGAYIAVPTRSWKPVRVKVEQISRVTLEDA